jgi:preprotein translocase subunit SecB
VSEHGVDIISSAQQGPVFFLSYIVRVFNSLLPANVPRILFPYETRARKQGIESRV